MPVWKILGIAAAAGIAVYGGLTAAIYWSMCQPPERFGAIMRHVPGVAMAILPFEPLWMRARAGQLGPGDLAPDFVLPTLDRTSMVRISDGYRSKPVVLIFGSYT